MNKNLISDYIEADYAYDLGDPDVIISDSVRKYGELPKKRVSLIPNRGKVPGFDLVRDEGAWTKAAITKPPGIMPGPIFVPKTARFNGRASCFFDSLDIKLNNFWDVPGHAILTVPADPTNHNYFFAAPKGHEQPFDVVVLNRPFGEPFPNSQAAIDTFEPEGGPTIGKGLERTGPNYWALTTGMPYNGHLWHSTDIEQDEDVTMVFIARIFGNQSFLEISWCDVNGTVRTKRTSMKLKNLGNLTNFYLGGTCSSYTSAVALKVGTWEENELDRVRSWATQFLPPAGELPKE